VSPSLNSFAAESVAHGVEMNVTALGAAGLGAYVTVAEIFEMDFDIDNMIEAIPVLGTRRTSYRWGRIKVSGSIKAYWVNQAVHTMWFGAGQPTAAGSASGIYHSAIPFARYNIRVTSVNPSAELMNFINVVFEKDVAKWTAEKFTEETINFVAEDVLQA
jgi:hypothetical protein